MANHVHLVLAERVEAGYGLASYSRQRQSRFDFPVRRVVPEKPCWLRAHEVGIVSR
jgi:hypothetical protein